MSRMALVLILGQTDANTLATGIGENAQVTALAPIRMEASTRAVSAIT